MYFGRTVKIPGDIVYGDLTTTIYQTEKGTERTGIEKWMDLINGHVSNVSSLEDETSSFMGKYSAKGTLTNYAKEGVGKPKRGLDYLKMIGASLFPTAATGVASVRARQGLDKPGKPGEKKDIMFAGTNPIGTYVPSYFNRKEDEFDVEDYNSWYETNKDTMGLENMDPMERYIRYQTWKKNN